MTIINIYVSDKLRDFSENVYSQGGLFFVDICETERDLCKILNGNELECFYPDWNEVALCLHKDWKLIRSWRLTDKTAKETVRYKFLKLFDRPDILTYIKSALEIYSVQEHGHDLSRYDAESRLRDVFCLNKEIFHTLWMCFDGNDDSYIALTEKIVLDMVQPCVTNLMKRVEERL